MKTRRNALALVAWHLLCGASFAAADASFRGLNLPPTQGTTRDGAFFTGQYHYDYNPDQVGTLLEQAGFTAVRLAVNRETALNASALSRHKSYIDALGGRGIICMFDTSSAPGRSWPRDGRLTGRLEASADAWRSVHSVFAKYGSNVMYEIFNEPWGYQTDTQTYVSDMLQVVRLAGLPMDRVILAGLHGSSDVQSVARAGWPGYLAYHCYSFWLPDGQRTRANFAARIKQDIWGLSSRVFITEFGVGLDGLPEDVDEEELRHDIRRHPDRKTSTADWMSERPSSATPVHDVCKKYPKSRWCRNLPLDAAMVQRSPNVGADVAARLEGDGAAATPTAPQNSGAVAPTAAPRESETMAFLGGLRDALESLRSQHQGIRGLFHWHGWHNGDTWDFWDRANAKSSRMIQLIMLDMVEEGSKSIDEDTFLSQDFTQDMQVVSMVRAADLSPRPTSACPLECSATYCQPGSEHEIGGKHLTQQHCIHTCSVQYSGMRYCGAGDAYVGAGSIDCSACADPLVCSGLPCLLHRTPAIHVQPAALAQHLPGFLSRRNSVHRSSWAL